MEIEIKIDSGRTEPKVVVHTAEVNTEVTALLERIQPPTTSTLVGFEGEVATILEPSTLIRLYAEHQKVYAETPAATCLVRLRLYEAEALLDARNFVRISHSEIINLRWVESMDLSFTGTICIRLKNGKTAFVSRRYVPKIKTKLGL